VDDLTRLALEARNGDDESLRLFVAATSARVHRLLAHLVDPASAEDVAQETYLRVLQALPRYRAAAPADIWLFAIARRTAADAIRARQRQRAVARSLLERTTTLTTACRSGEVELYQLLAQLTEERRVAFVLTQILGFDYAAAAAIMGCPIGTVRSRVARARSELQTMTSGTDVETA
jgi:RNA polymerase sigma-70 factor (ECF subfamily)